jgi:hypothetical protein
VFSLPPTPGRPYREFARACRMLKKMTPGRRPARPSAKLRSEHPAANRVSRRVASEMDSGAIWHGRRTAPTTKRRPRSQFRGPPVAWNGRGASVSAVADGTDFRSSNYLAGGGNCKRPRLGFRMLKSCSSVRQSWTWHRVLRPSAVNAKCRSARLSRGGNDRGRDQRRDGSGWTRCGRKDRDSGAASIESWHVIGPTAAVA